MEYKVSFSKSAQKSLKKMDKFTSKIIYSWIGKNLQGTTNPRNHGKGLTGNKSGFWRYRIGDYRIIADIDDKNIIIYVIEIGHRKKIYK